ncbi:restriction endonuclease subunit S [Shewanella algae]|uniref:restriction endonuclease subunit S n=1 Tax=Shewanella algae TaxID=38313 RepID=UPI0008DD691C|nr:restriction endonuclease subunit S [Shewanella algae]OHY56131.1 restriction endonuclease subunit S [Shewanella algae]
MARSLAKDAIPNGWKYDLLDKFSTRCSGHTPSKSFPEYWDGGIKWISLADSFRLDQGYVYETDKEISEAGIANSSAELHPAETVVLSRDAGIGKSGVMAVPMAVSQHFIAWKCDNTEKLNSWFLYNWLQLNKAEFERQAVGSTIKTIGLPYFKKLKIAVPPYSEQKKIAQILSTWDKAITTTEQLLHNSQQQKKSLMQQLLTGPHPSKPRLLDDNGVRFGGEWKHQRLASLCTIKTGKKDVNEGNPEGNYPFFTCASEPTKSDNYSYDCEALLIAGNGMLGKTHYFNGKFEAYQRTYILSEFIGIDVPFLHQYILYWLMRDIDREKQHGAMPYIKLGLLQNFKVLLPSIAEQQKIAAVLSIADQEITALQQKLDALKQEKKALMQQLLTGKRRVKIEGVGNA